MTCALKPSCKTCRAADVDLPHRGVWQCSTDAGCCCTQAGIKSSCALMVQPINK